MESMEGLENIEVLRSQAVLCQVCTVKPALLLCNCVTPKATLCTDCVSPHFRTTGLHTIDLINLEKPIFNSSNVQCVLCQRKEADYICVCREAYTALFPMHRKARRHCILGRPHLHQLQGLLFFNGTHYLINLRTRQVGTGKGRVMLMNSLERINAAQKQVMDHFEGLIVEARKLQAEKVQEFRSMKEQFQAMVDSALTKAEEHVYENNYQSINWLTPAIWNYRTQFADLHFFTYASDDNYSSMTNTQDILNQSPFTQLITILR